MDVGEGVASVGGGKGTLELRADGVLHLIWCPHARLEEADIKAAMARIKDVCHGCACPLLVEMSDLENVSPGARAAFAFPVPPPVSPYWDPPP